MSVVVAFLLALAILCLVLVACVVTPHYGDSNRRKVRELSKDLTESERRERIATNALRAIANGAGAPVLEASDALDRIQSTYTKELN